MKPSSTLLSIMIMTISHADSAHATERCGDNILPSAVTQVCFDDAAWQLRISYRESQASTSYPMSSYSPRTYTAGTLRVLEYEFKHERRGFYREVYRDVEESEVTGSRMWRFEYIEGVAPNGDSFRAERLGTH